jgi:hypothetical protein
MKKRYVYNEHCICTNPDVVWKISDPQITIKIMVAEYQDKWLSGYQYSVYSMDPEGTSNLVYPRIEEYKQLFDKHEYATHYAKVAIKCLIQDSIKVEPRMEHVPVIKSFHNLFFPERK